MKMFSMFMVCPSSKWISKCLSFYEEYVINIYKKYLIADTLIDKQTK